VQATPSLCQDTQPHIGETRPQRRGTRSAFETRRRAHIALVCWAHISCFAPRVTETAFKTFLLASSAALPEIAMESTCPPTSCARTVSCRYSAPCKVHPTPTTTILWLRFGHPFRQLADSHFRSMSQYWKPTSPHQGVLLPLDLVAPVFACPVIHITSSQVITAKSLPRSQTWRPEP
jgi:hypothetical protein